MKGSKAEATYRDGKRRMAKTDCDGEVKATNQHCNDSLEYEAMAHITADVDDLVELSMSIFQGELMKICASLDSPEVRESIMKAIMTKQSTARSSRTGSSKSPVGHIHGRVKRWISHSYATKFAKRC